MFHPAFQYYETQFPIVVDTIPPHIIFEITFAIMNYELCCFTRNTRARLRPIKHFRFRLFRVFRYRFIIFVRRRSESFSSYNNGELNGATHTHTIARGGQSQWRVCVCVGTRLNLFWLSTFFAIRQQTITS